MYSRSDRSPNGARAFRPHPDPPAAPCSRRGLARKFWSAGALATLPWLAARGAPAAAAEVAGSEGGPGTGVYDVRDYGAALDGATDDASALQAALDACSAGGGGTVYIPGRLLMRRPVRRDFLRTAAAVTLRGSGSASQIITVPGAGRTGLTLANLESLLIEDLVFAGAPGFGVDAKVALSISYCLQATLRNSHFYALFCVDRGGAVVHAHNSSLRLESCSFRGCAADLMNEVPVVQNEQWLGISVQDTDFIDFGQLDGEYRSKTPRGQPYAWVRAGEPAAGHPHWQGHVVVRNSRFDEGAYHGFICDPPKSGRRVNHVLLSGVRVNGALNDGAASVVIARAEKVRIEQTSFGWAQRERAGIRLVDAGDVELDAVHCLDGHNRIEADAATRSLVVRNCIYGALSSGARVTRIARDGLEGPPVVTTGQRNALRQPPPGAIVFNRDSRKLNFWNGAAWKTLR